MFLTCNHSHYNILEAIFRAGGTIFGPAVKKIILKEKVEEDFKIDVCFHSADQMKIFLCILDQNLQLKETVIHGGKINIYATYPIALFDTDNLIMTNFNKFASRDRELDPLELIKKIIYKEMAVLPNYYSFLLSEISRDQLVSNQQMLQILLDEQWKINLPTGYVLPSILYLRKFRRSTLHSTMVEPM